MKIQLNYYSEIKEEPVVVGTTYEVDKHAHHWWALNANTIMWLEEQPDLIFFWTVAEWGTDLWPKQAIDHSALLSKYIEYIGYVEGIDFLDFDRHDTPGGFFTEVEWNRLQVLSGRKVVGGASNL